MNDIIRTSNEKLIDDFAAAVRSEYANSTPYTRRELDETRAALLAERNTIETRADPACIDCIELKNALAAAVGVANEARECHDRDQDMRVMKLLMALAGHVPKYRADTDHIHDVLRRAVERLTSPAHAQECDFAQGECTCGADLAAGERNRAALKANEPPGDRHDRSRQCAVTAQDPTRAPGGSAESEPEV